AAQRNREGFRGLDHGVLRGGDRKRQQRRTRRQVGAGVVGRRHMDRAVRVSSDVRQSNVRRPGQPSRQQRQIGSASGRGPRGAIQRERHALARAKPHSTTQAHRVGAGRGAFSNRRRTAQRDRRRVVVDNARRDRWGGHRRRRAAKRNREGFRGLDHGVLRGGDRKRQQRRTRRQVGAGVVGRRHMDRAVRVSSDVRQSNVRRPGQPSRQQRREVHPFGRRPRGAIQRERHALARAKPYSTTQAHRVGAGRGAFANRRRTAQRDRRRVVVDDARRDRWGGHRRRRAAQRNREGFRPLNDGVLRGGDRKRQQRRTRRQVGAGVVGRRHMDRAL